MTRICQVRSWRRARFKRSGAFGGVECVFAEVYNDDRACVCEMLMMKVVSEQISGNRGNMIQ